MKLGIIGSGNVGQVIGAGFAQRGHEVKLGTRDPNSEKIKEWINKTGHKVTAGNFAQTANFGEIILLATNWEGTENAIKLAGAENFADKILIDLTNPLTSAPGIPKLAVSGNDSAGESVQRWLPQAKVVKAFNQVTAATMVNPQREEGTPDMFIAGNDAEAKQVVTKLLKDFGWGVVDTGDIHAARYLEAIAMIWIEYMFNHNIFTHAFKFLQK